MDMPLTLGQMNGAFLASYYPHKNLDTNAAAFETQNGESIVVYYNPNCLSDSGEAIYKFWDFTQPYMCTNFVYDLNGLKGPNTFGKDIGAISVLYSTDSNVVATETVKPISFEYADNLDLARNFCKTKDENFRLPNRDELTAIFYNRQFLGITQDYFWSGTTVGSYVWLMNLQTGGRAVYSRKGVRYVPCVKR